MKKRIAALLLTITICISNVSYALAEPKSQPQLNEKVKIVSETVDSKVMTYINDIDDSLSETFSGDNIESLKDEAFKKFSALIDFVFYDQEINGVKFNDLTSETKAKIIDVFVRYFPHFKEDISHAYGQLQDDLSTLLEKADQQLLDSIGQDNCDKLKGFSTSLKEAAKEVLDKGKQYTKNGWKKFKSWYEDKKNGN